MNEGPLLFWIVMFIFGIALLFTHNKKPASVVAVCPACGEQVQATVKKSCNELVAVGLLLLALPANLVIFLLWGGALADQSGVYDNWVHLTTWPFILSGVLGLAYIWATMSKYKVFCGACGAFFGEGKNPLALVQAVPAAATAVAPSLPPLSGETCANCGRVLGRLEKAHLWEEKVVCGPCRKILET